MKVSGGSGGGAAGVSVAHQPVGAGLASALGERAWAALAPGRVASVGRASAVPERLLGAGLPDQVPPLPRPCPAPADGFTPLMIASCSGGGLETGKSEEEEDAPAVISDFIYQGASLHSQTDRTGETALHLAARYSRSDAAKRLLEAGADANIQDNMGRTPLHAAVAADAQGVFQVGSRARALLLACARLPSSWPGPGALIPSVARAGAAGVSPASPPRAFAP